MGNAKGVEQASSPSSCSKAGLSRKIAVDRYKAHEIRRLIRLVLILKSLCNFVARQVRIFVAYARRAATGSPVNVDDLD